MPNSERVPNRLINEKSPYLYNTPIIQLTGFHGVKKLLQKQKLKIIQFSCLLDTPDVGAVSLLSLVASKLLTEKYLIKS